MAIAVFLDRDGTLNEEVGYIKDVNDLNLIPGAAQAVKQLNDLGILAILTTNQTGAARGYYDEAHILALNTRLQTLLQQEANAHLDAVYYCPHYETGIVPEYTMVCHCRKPAPGMIEEAKKCFPEIDLAQSYVLGDKASDVEFAQNAGCKGILLETGFGQRVLSGDYQSLNSPPYRVCRDIVEAVHFILDDIRLVHTPSSV